MIIEITEEYIALKPNVGGIAFWRAITRYIRDDVEEFKVLGIAIDSKRWIYIFPRTVLKDIFIENVVPAFIDFAFILRNANIVINTAQREIVVKVQKLDRWTRILHIDDGVSRYIVYPCRRIKEKMERNQERAPQSSF